MKVKKYFQKTYWSSLLQAGYKPIGEREIESVVEKKDGTFGKTDETPLSERKTYEVSYDTDNLSKGESVFASEEWWEEYKKSRPAQVWSEIAITISKRLALSVKSKTIESLIETEGDVFHSVYFWEGVLLWTIDNREVTYLGQRDKALHFAFGALAEAKQGIGDQVGHLKELFDHYFEFGQFDPEDEAATSAGAEFVRDRNPSKKVEN